MLSNSGVFGSLNRTFVNHMLHTDDICLLLLVVYVIDNYSDAFSEIVEFCTAVCNYSLVFMHVSPCHVF